MLLGEHELKSEFSSSDIPASFKNFSSSDGFHPRPESVFSHALFLFWLIDSLRHSSKYSNGACSSVHGCAQLRRQRKGLFNFFHDLLAVPGIYDNDKVVGRIGSDFC